DADPARRHAGPWSDARVRQAVLVLRVHWHVSVPFTANGRATHDAFLPSSRKQPMRAFFWLLMSATLVAGCRHAPPAASTHYALHASYPLPGPGRWDLIAMDSARGHVFVARGDR